MNGNAAPQWVGLAVVQSYNARRKVPRSKISIPDLERCLSKVSFSAAQNAGKFLHHLNYIHVEFIVLWSKFILDPNS